MSRKAEVLGKRESCSSSYTLVLTLLALLATQQVMCDMIVSRLDRGWWHKEASTEVVRKKWANEETSWRSTSAVQCQRVRRDQTLNFSVFIESYSIHIAMVLRFWGSFLQTHTWASSFVKFQYFLYFEQTFQFFRKGLIKSASLGWVPLHFCTCDSWVFSLFGHLLCLGFPSACTRLFYSWYHGSCSVHLTPYLVHASLVIASRSTGHLCRDH